ncbi:hypothetical protein OROHE_014100 [Orobanche hederae]
MEWSRFSRLCMDKLSYFRVKELKEVLTQLGLPKQGRKQDLADRVLASLSDERGLLAKKNAVRKDEVAKVVDDTYRKMQVYGAANLASKAQGFSDSVNVKSKEAVVDSHQMDKIRCLCGSPQPTDSMIKCEDPRCNVWQHIACVVIPEKPEEGLLPSPPEIFYCESCRLNLADPFWKTVAHPLYPAKSKITNVPVDGSNPVLSIENTFHLTRADKDLLLKQEYDVQAWCMLLNDKVPFRMQWPQYADLQVNGVPVRAMNRSGSQLLGANGRDDGPVITQCTRDGINKISLTGRDARIFCVGVRIVNRRTLHQVFEFFIDLEKAYDKVPREVLWWALAKKDVSRKYIDIIKDMYEGASTSVRTNVGRTEEFPITIGVHQGSALSPFLFAIVMDELTRGIQTDVPWCMMFADDIVLIEETKVGVQQKLELWRDTLEARGFRLSRSKTEYMECRFSDNSDREAGMITFDGKVVHGSAFFRYLGSIIQKDGELDGDVAHRIKAGWLKWKSATGVLCDPGMPHRLKGKFYRTAIRPALLYGTECWAVKQCHVQKMNVAEMRMLRWMCGHTKKDRLRNEVIREKVRVVSIEDKMMENRLRWFGHVRRRLVDAPVRRLESWGTSNIVKGRGRPKKTWIKSIENDMRFLGIGESMAMERQIWRERIRVILSLIPKEAEGECFEDALVRVRRCIGGGATTENADLDRDIEVVADSVPVNLRCPHEWFKNEGGWKVQALHTHGLFRSGSVCGNEPTLQEDWQCPVCLKNYSWEKIIIDPYFNQITSKLRDFGEDAAEVEVKTDGSWRVKADYHGTGLGNLGLWHLPDGTLCDSSKIELLPKPELKPDQHEAGCDNLAALKLGIKKNRNGCWEFSKPIESNGPNIIAMSSSTTDSGIDCEDASVNQDAGFNDPFTAATAGDTEVIVLSDSEEDTEQLMSYGPVRENKTSILPGTDGSRTGKTSRGRSDSSSSCLHQERCVKPRVYLSIDSD